jgi:hypothetical protein
VPSQVVRHTLQQTETLIIIQFWQDDTGHRHIIDIYVKMSYELQMMKAANAMIKWPQLAHMLGVRPVHI